MSETDGIRNRNLTLIDTLEALYFLTQSLDDNQDRLELLRANIDKLNADEQVEFTREIEGEVREVREHFGAIAGDEELRDLYSQAKNNPGYSYLLKQSLEAHYFKNYMRVFPRWPNIPSHATVVFDGQTTRGLNQVFTLEGSIFADAASLLSEAIKIREAEGDFRKRSSEQQFAALTYSRACILMTFTFVEAYLNGIAFDCFHQHHDALSLEEHDLLAEWNSKKKRRMFVQFETKLFRYPEIIGAMSGAVVDMTKSASAQLLANDGKKLRDSLTHASPYVDPHSGRHEKLFWMTGVGVNPSEQVWKAAHDYVVSVELGLKRDPQETIPWIFKKGGHPLCMGHG